MILATSAAVAHSSILVPFAILGTLVILPNAVVSFFALRARALPCERCGLQCTAAERRTHEKGGCAETS